MLSNIIVIEIYNNIQRSDNMYYKTVYNKKSNDYIFIYLSIYKYQHFSRYNILSLFNSPKNS